MWGNRSKQNQNETAGGDFDAAAARVTAAGEDQPLPSEAAADAVGAGDKLEIRPEWANAAARLCFLPAARLSHPAFALTDEEAEKIAPQMQALLQAAADKYAPALVGRVATRHPEFFDAVAAVGVLYWQKWRFVSRLRQEEAAARAAAGKPGAESPAAEVVIDLPRPKVGERTADGALVI